MQPRTVRRANEAGPGANAPDRMPQPANSVWRAAIAEPAGGQGGDRRCLATLRRASAGLDQVRIFLGHDFLRREIQHLEQL